MRSLILSLAIVAYATALMAGKHRFASHIHHARDSERGDHPVVTVNFEEDEERKNEFCPAGLKPSERLLTTHHTKPNVAYFVLVGTNGFDENSPPLQQLVQEFKTLGNSRNNFIDNHPDIFHQLLTHLANMDINQPDSFDAPIADLGVLRDQSRTTIRNLRRDQNRALIGSSLMKLLTKMRKALVIIKGIASFQIECRFRYAPGSYTEITVNCVAQNDIGNLLDRFTTLNGALADKIKRGLMAVQPSTCQCRADPSFVDEGVMTVENDFLRGLNLQSEMQLGMNLGILIGLTSEGGCPSHEDTGLTTYTNKASNYAADFMQKFNYWFLGQQATMLKDVLQAAVLADPDQQIIADLRDLREELLDRLKTLKRSDGKAAQNTHPILELKNGINLFNLRKETSNSLKAIAYDSTNINPKLRNFIRADRAMHGLVGKAILGSLTINDFKKLNKGNTMRSPDNSRDKEWVREGVTGGVFDIYLPPSAVPQAVTDLVTWFNSKTNTNDGRKDTILTAARAFSWCVSIHPFHDGNGRACRLLGDLALLAGGLLPGYWTKSVAIYPQRVRAKEGQFSFAADLAESGQLAATAAVNAICGDDQDCQ